MVIMTVCGIRKCEELDILAILMVSLNHLTMRTPGTFIAMSGWIRVSLTLRMDLMDFSRRTRRPSCLSLNVRLGRLLRKRLHRYDCSTIRGVHLFLRRILTPDR